MSNFSFQLVFSAFSFLEGEIKRGKTLRKKEKGKRGRRGKM